MQLQLLSVNGSLQDPFFSVSAKTEKSVLNWLQKETTNYSPIVCDHEGNRYTEDSQEFMSMQTLAEKYQTKKTKKKSSKKKPASV